ncbi:MAG: DUF664 domain-containing protein [Bacteroidota bacterium]
MKRIQTLLLCLVLGSSAYLNAQYKVTPTEGYSPQIGTMVNMLEDIKNRISEMTQDLNQTQTDYLFDKEANSIGAIIMHIVAIEDYTRVETLEARQWTDEEALFWSTASDLGGNTQKSLQGKPIQYYFDIWDEVRAKTLEGLKQKDDAWFASDIDEQMNYHWAWFHVVEHAASHMGQIALVQNRFPK